MEASAALVHIPAGEFWMGSEDRHAPEGPRHRVFTDAYEIAATPVRRSDYERFRDEAPVPEPRGWTDPAFADPEQPVVGVSWFDAVAYCEWLTAATGEDYRLPTEAEWERACRGGVDSEYSWGDRRPESIAYYQGRWRAPRPVAESEPNPYGLFNMGDNVHEWCLDWYAADYYAESPLENPAGPPSGQRRVSRGGSWRHAIRASRAAHRSSLPPEYRYTDYGFRVVRGVRAGAGRAKARPAGLSR